MKTITHTHARKRLNTIVENDKLFLTTETLLHHFRNDERL